MNFQVHAQQLAKALDVRLIETDQLSWWESFALCKRRCAIVPPIIEPIAYAAALHELGHIAAPSESWSRMSVEEDAWAWARQKALIWTPDMEAAAQEALASYDVETFAEQEQRLNPEAVDQ